MQMTESAGRWRRAGGVARDLLIATALVWTLPLAFGLFSALVRLVAGE